MQEITTKRSLAFAKIAMALAMGLSTGPVVLGQASKELPSTYQEIGVDQKLGDTLPLNTEFTNEKGQKVRLKQFFDGQRPVLITLNYSDCPMLCSLQLNQLVQTLDGFELDIADDFQIVTVSIDPKETPLKIRETKQKYAGVLPQEGAAEGWHFLIGEQKSITALADAIGFRYTFVPETGQYNHAAMLAFCTPEGKISSYLLLIDYPANQVKLGLIDASDGTIGTLVDNFLLYCSTYNPLEGSYTASAWKIMRVCGAATVIILLVTLVPYWMNRKRSRLHTLEHSNVNPAALEGQQSLAATEP